MQINNFEELPGEQGDMPRSPQELIEMLRKRHAEEVEDKVLDSFKMSKKQIQAFKELLTQRQKTEREHRKAQAMDRQFWALVDRENPERTHEQMIVQWDRQEIGILAQEIDPRIDPNLHNT